jgi:fibronectin-binding autotransporter adhesin
MKKVFKGITAMALLCLAAQGATVNTTIAITGTGKSASGSITATGTVSFTGGLTGSGTFSSNFSLTNASTLQGIIPVSFTVTTGSITGTLTGTLTASPTLLLQVLTATSSASGTGTMAITAGTAGFAGATGSFASVNVAGAGSGSTGSGAGTFTITGPGTLTLAGSTGPAPPAITSVLNNYGLIPPGFPNYGIAPGALFIIKGTGLADPTAQAILQSSASPGIPLTLNGAILSVTVNGTTVYPGIYYATATQIAAVLPAATPLGTGTVTVTYNGSATATAAIQVVRAALGLGTYNGLAIATNPTTGALYTYTNSIKPGDTIVLWGSGLGAISADSDTVFTSTPHAGSVPLQIYIGGVQATVLYAGDSGYPGVNQLDVTVPTSVSPGCNVSLVAVSGSGSILTTSNSTAIAVSPSGGVCSDPLFGTDGTATTTLSGKTNISTGSVILAHSVSPGSTAGTTQTNDIAEASFQKTDGSSVTASGVRSSVGSCSITQNVTGTPGTGSTTGLDAGVISVTGPAASATLTPLGSASPGLSLAQLATGFIPSTGGAFTFKGTGGADVGSFSVTVNFPNPAVAWTNQAAAATINRVSGATFTWTGGAANSYVEITGSSAAASGGAVGNYYCFAPASAGTFTVPNFVLLGLPSGTGSTSLTNTTSYTAFTATGLDTAFAFGFLQTQAKTIYQ